MMESVESIRKKLTSNEDADIYIDALMNEEDLEIAYTREQF